MPGVRALLGDPQAALLIARPGRAAHRLARRASRPSSTTASAPTLAPTELGAGERRLVRARDAVWAVGRDRLRTAREVGAARRAPTRRSPPSRRSSRCRSRCRRSTGSRCAAATPPGCTCSCAITASTSTNPRSGAWSTLRADRPAVRLGLGAGDGRRAGVRVQGGGRDRRARRQHRGAARRRSATTSCCTSRSPIDAAEVMVLGHTRWASVGIISEANAHPLNHEELDGDDRPYVVGALNGDVDNYADLKALEQLQVPAEITTDAKVIPALVARRLAAGATVDDAFRTTVAELAGSVAIAAQTAAAPDRAAALAARQRPGALRRAGGGRLRRRQRALRPGRGDGHVPAHGRRDAGRPRAGRGHPRPGRGARRRARRHARRHPALLVRRHAAAGVTPTSSSTPRSRPATSTAATFPHFLLKEISEAPASFRKTLRGQGRRARRAARRSRSVPRRCPTTLRARLRDGSIRRVVVIGQGTAAIAGQSLAAVLAGARRRPAARRGRRRHRVLGLPARATTCPTRSSSRSARAAPPPTPTAPSTSRARAAPRSSRSSTGATATSSTSPTACSTRPTGATSRWRCRRPRRSTRRSRPGPCSRSRIADEVDDAAIRRAVHELLDALRALPDAMLARARAARRDRRDRAAARRCRGATGRSSATAATASPRAEVRVKLSELCYKSIACDVTEDKKHIDLSAEPLILVCAAGLQGSNADDVAKEIAIYRAHRAAPIVIADDGERRFDAALETIPVPVVHPDVAFVLSAMAGHLFGYEAALAIDASARPLREARAAIADRGRRRADDGDDLLAAPATRRSSRPAAHVLRRAARRRLRRPPRSRHRGAHRVAAALRDRHRAARRVPGRARQGGHAERGGRRPHRRAHRRHRGAHPAGRRDQAPGEDGHRRHLPFRRGAAPGPAGARGARGGRARATRSATARCARWSRSTPRSSRSSASPATASRATSTPTTPPSTSSTAAASRVDLRSRTDDDPRLVGTKHRVATEREVTVARGRRDGRTRDHRARGEGQPDRRAHAAARALRRPPPGRRRPHRAAGLPGPLRRAARRGHRDQADVRRQPARRRSTSSTCSPSRSTSSPTAGADVGTARTSGTRTASAAVNGLDERVLGIRGLGTDLVEIERFRLALARRRQPARSALHRRASRSTRSGSTIRCTASRPASAPRRR